MSDASRTKASRDFATLHRVGVLSTNSKSNVGFPFGSVVPYDIDSWGRIVIYISLIAEHYKNLSVDPRASLIILDPYGMHDPQASARATLLLNFSPVPEEERAAVEENYLGRFPGAVNREIAHNFLTTVRVRTDLRAVSSVSWMNNAEFVGYHISSMAMMREGTDICSAASLRG